MIQGYLKQNPDATLEEIGSLLGVTKQGAYRTLKLLGIGTQRQQIRKELTKREVEILRYTANGNSNREIAETLDTTERTIKNQITFILAKMHASNRAHAVALALKQGLIPLDEVKSVKAVSE